jgi:hypothetical protein
MHSNFSGEHLPPPTFAFTWYFPYDTQSFSDASLKKCLPLSHSHSWGYWKEKKILIREVQLHNTHPWPLSWKCRRHVSTCSCNANNVSWKWLTSQCCICRDWIRGWVTCWPRYLPSIFLPRYLHGNFFHSQQQQRFVSRSHHQNGPFQLTVLSTHHKGTHMMCTISVAILCCCPWGLHMASADCYLGWELAPDKLTTCFVFAVASDNL